MRGCLSDIIHYNHSAISTSSKMSSRVMGSAMRSKTSSSSTSNLFCTFVRLRDLFLTSNRYNFDSFDHVELCTCAQPLCNKAMRASIAPNFFAIYIFALTITTIFWYYNLIIQNCFVHNIDNEISAIEKLISKRYLLRNFNYVTEKLNVK